MSDLDVNARYGPARNDGSLLNPNEGHTILLVDALAMVAAATFPLKARVAELEAYAASLDAQLIAAIAAPPVRDAGEVECTGCRTPRIGAIAMVICGKAGCCPDCSTLTVDERNEIRAAVVSDRLATPPAEVTEAMVDAALPASGVKHSAGYGDA